MTVKLNQSNVNAYLEAVLNAFKDGKIDTLKARNELAQALTMAAIDNERDLVPYMQVSDFEERWGLT